MVKDAHQKVPDTPGNPKRLRKGSYPQITRTLNEDIASSWPSFSAVVCFVLSGGLTVYLCCFALQRQV